MMVVGTVVGTVEITVLETKLVCAGRELTSLVLEV